MWPQNKSDSSDIDNRHTVVGLQENTILVEAEHHHWISISSGTAEVCRESGCAPLTLFVVEPGEYVVRSDGAVRGVSNEYRELPSPPWARGSQDEQLTLRISSDAPDQHQVDGVGEIPADGTSAATVTVQAIDPEQRAADREVEIFLRATGGVLMDTSGETRIRSVRLQAGTATFRLMSESFPRFVTVFAFSRDQKLRAELPLEFV